jgi:hypothetical protein
MLYLSSLQPIHAATASRASWSRIFLNKKKTQNNAATTPPAATR